MKKKIIFLVAAALMLNSCDDLFEPAIENFKDVEQMYDDAQYAQGFLVNVYRCVPGYYDNSEYATDDAVINQKNNAFLTMATGGWTSRLWTPINQWTNSFSSIQYINLFLENVDKVRWSLMDFAVCFYTICFVHMLDLEKTENCSVYLV